MSTFLIRSCVIGRGVETFSISSAIAFASYTPTHIGSTVSPPTSLRITIGILLTGSIINPRIVISTSIWRDLHPGAEASLYHQFTSQTVGKTARHQYLLVASHLRTDAIRSREVERLILRCPPNPLRLGFISNFNHHFRYRSYVFLVAINLDIALFSHQYVQAP